jgi:hypothetical protein
MEERWDVDAHADPSEASEEFLSSLAIASGLGFAFTLIFAGLRGEMWCLSTDTDSCFHLHASSDVESRTTFWLALLVG